ncbi:MAG TPA: NAD(P)-dependent oxidoreductase [Nocardioidaceae bacterium]|nr:NAD(P)-dependent oxidoreductase [Nocardioidaceae bacterium]
MTDRPRFLYVSPRENGWWSTLSSRRYFHGGERYRSLAEAVLSPHGTVDCLEWGVDDPAEERAEQLDARLADADALVASPWLWLGEGGTFDDARLGRAPKLKAIAGTFDYRLGWVDLDAASRRGVTVVDTSRTMTWTVAEFAVAITFALLRDIPRSVDLVRSGGWQDSGKTGGAYLFRDLADCHIGLAGFGSINKHYRRFVEPYGCPVTVFDPQVDDEVAAAYSVTRADSLVDLARASDIFVVAIPPTPSTLGVIDAEVIDALAPGSLFVLVSRMAVVEQEPLWGRARAEELRVAVDVFDPEPPPRDAWFRGAANVIPTPHIAGNTPFAHERCLTEACADAVRIVSGEAPLHAATTLDKSIYEGKLAAETS